MQAVSGDDWQRRMQQQQQQMAAQQSRQGIQNGFGISSPAQPAQPAQPVQPQTGGSYLGASGSDPASQAARAGGFTSSPRGGWGGGGWGGGFGGGGGGWMREGQGDPRAAMQQNQQELFAQQNRPRMFANLRGPQSPGNPSVGGSLQPSQQDPSMAVKQMQNAYQGAQQPQQNQPNPAMQAAIESMRRRQAQPRRTIPLS